MQFDEVAKRLRQMGGGSFGKGAPVELIEQAEKTLGVSIRGSYREFLREFGWAEPGSIAIFGLGTDLPKSYIDLVGMTTSERSEMHPNIPHHLLPLMNDGYGNHYCLDVSSAGDEPQIVFWNHENGEDQVPEICAESFTLWLNEMLDWEEQAG